MFRTIAHAVLGMVVAVGCIDAASVFAQKTTSEVRLEGYGGTLVVRSNAQRKEVTAALTLSYSREGKSNQIVFHIQAEDGALPENWAGPAHVLSGDGVLAVIPDDGKGGMLFRFSEVERPSSLATLQLNEYKVYGIARYGETKPLSSEEIDTLARTGRPSDSSDDFNPKALRVSPDSASTEPYATGPIFCQAGGPGSGGCGVTGCSVSCTSGYYSCCANGFCLCVPNK